MSAMVGRRARCSCCGEVTAYRKRVAKKIERREWRREVDA